MRASGTSAGSQTGRENDDMKADAASPAIRVCAMPADANPYGDIFGGWLMSQMDTAAGLVAARAAGGRAVTVAVDGMSFVRPVKVGDEVSVVGEVVRRGRTSLSIHIQAWRRDRHEEGAELVTEATFTFVALDADGRPRRIDEAARLD
ncbi:cytosolic long-chain acyl-CoA thioester hydrolase family protein [Phenylobacterium zucineum HLK1]|uniref:Cytosolic long-chain acyl-CoA thioester hydrolase family protein n=2 Tax=Phenylobacterium zucineum TaxID=284016 RepID=B4RFZ8_PHEZH|nr:cytosolic long-chain acyl-CoA thioester hydrolase family protein [Phenylobacterium zucineum HLK1]